MRKHEVSFLSTSSISIFTNILAIFVFISFLFSILIIISACSGGFGNGAESAAGNGNVENNGIIEAAAAVTAMSDADADADAAAMPATDTDADMASSEMAVIGSNAATMSVNYDAIAKKADMLSSDNDSDIERVSDYAKDSDSNSDSDSDSDSDSNNISISNENRLGMRAPEENTIIRVYPGSKSYTSKTSPYGTASSGCPPINAATACWRWLTSAIRSSGGNNITGASELADYVRGEYDSFDMYAYTEPLNKIPYNAKIAFSGEFLKQGLWLESFHSYINDSIHVYYSSYFSEMTEVQCMLEYDKNTSELIVSPFIPAFAIDRDSSAEAQSADIKQITGWGNAPKYYIVRNIDFDTGAKLKKPLVTLFTIQTELESPQLKFRVDEQGRLLFYWDKIDGADNYSIGQIFFGDGVSGLGYSNFLKIDEVSGNEWRKIGDVKTLSREIEDINAIGAAKWFMESAYQQNMSLADFSTFFSSDIGIAAIAVNKNGNSSISNIVPFSEFASMTPHKPEISFSNRYFGGDGNLTLKQSGEAIVIGNLLYAPVYQSIEMLDGSYKLFVIDYPDTLDGVDDYKGQARIITGTHGTMFKNGIVITDLGGRSMSEALAYLNAREENALRAAGGIAYSDINLDAGDAAGDAGGAGKVGDAAGDAGGASGGSGESSSGSASSGSGAGNASGAGNTSGAGGTADAPGMDYEENEIVAERIYGIDPYELIYYEMQKIYANSALSAYLALNFINHAETITLRDFPEASDVDVLVDAVLEAYYQNNHYIGGIEMNYIMYDHISRTLTVPYVMTIGEHKRLISEVDAAADEIVARIITDDMSDYEKEEAINNYICDNAEYDYDALEAMVRITDLQIISDKYKFSQTAYGALIEGKGICQAYAEAFNLLASKAGLQSVVVTGVLNGAGGHAWNRALIDGQWFTLDVLSNDSDDYYNEYFNMPDEVAAYFVTENNKYALDRVLQQFTAAEYGYDYYSKNGMSTDLAGLEQYLSGQLISGANIDIYIDDILNISDEELFEALNKAAQSAEVTLRSRMLFWILRITCD